MSTSTSSSTTAQTDELKAKHRKMWALGDYASVASDVVGGSRPCPGRGNRDHQR